MTKQRFPKRVFNYLAEVEQWEGRFAYEWGVKTRDEMLEKGYIEAHKPERVSRECVKLTESGSAYLNSLRGLQSPK